MSRIRTVDINRPLPVFAVALKFSVAPLALACMLAYGPAAVACNAGSSSQLAACVGNLASDSTINLTSNITLSGNLGVIAANATINGNGFTLDGASTYRGFFVGSGTVAINDLTMANMTAKGGNGGSVNIGSGGGGGLGAGGAVFVQSGASVTLNNVALDHSTAVGGNGGSSAQTGGVPAGGGGGGMGGNGGSALLNAGAGAGGGGLFENGQNAEAGRAGGGPAGGGIVGNVGQPGGDYSGGGGANGLPSPGGSGGLGGGGGGTFAGNAGAGGFGGGGGGSPQNGAGGAGGFGGGGGGGAIAGAGGFGGGDGHQVDGGGGAGMGGAIFVMDGGAIIITGSFTVDSSSVTAGLGGSTAGNGSAFGSAIFLQGSTASLTYTPAAGQMQTVNGDIADQSGSGGAGANAGSIGITKSGAGVLTLTGNNTYSGGTSITDGRLDISSGAALGSGAVTVSGGTLRSLASTTIANDLTIASGAALDLNSYDVTLANLQGAGSVQTGSNASARLTVQAGNFSGDIAGASTLVKTTAGTLTLGGTNTYTGGTYIEAGSLSITAASALGTAQTVSVFGGATLALNGNTVTIKDLQGAGTVQTGNNGGSDFIVQSGAFSGTIDGAAALRKDTAATLILSGTNTYSGGTSVLAGTLQGNTRSLQGNIDNAGTVLFQQDEDGSYAGVLGGAGLLAKQGVALLILTGDSSGYIGTTEVRAGGLQVQGSLGGAVGVQRGAVLSGTGAVGSTTIAAGGALVPGTGSDLHGRLTVNGNLTLAPGSSYTVFTDATGASNSVHATGTASVAGTVLNIATDGNYGLSTRYSILAADSGVSGTFDSLTSNLAYLAPTLEYGANKVDLVIGLKQVPGDGDSPSAGAGTAPADGGTTAPTRPIRFADLAANGNQRAVADALQSLPTTTPLFARVLNLPNGAPAGVFASLSGEAHASTLHSLQGVGDRVGMLPMSHLRDNLAAGWLPGPPTAQLGGSDAASLPQSAAQPVWAQVFGNWRNQSGSGDIARTSESDSGLFVGGDRGIGGGWRVGGALGYTDSQLSVRGLGSSSNVDSYSATIYGGKAFAAGIGKINLSLGAAYTWHDVRTKRQANAAGVAQELKASYGASTGQFFGELGYAVPLNDRVTLEPFVGASYNDLRTRGFSETGGDAALNGQSNRSQLAATTLGLHAQTLFESDGAPGRVHATLGWRHAYGDVNPETTLAFQGSQTFTVTGTPIARDAAVVELGVDMSVTKRTTVGLVYGGQFGASTRQNAGSLDIRYRF